MIKKITTDKDTWEGSIIKDLAFIKQHKRYRWTAKLRLPIVVFAVLFTLSACLYFFSSTPSDGPVQAKRWVQFLIPLGALAVMASFMWRYLESLKFIELKTMLTKETNHNLVVAFLNEKHLLVYHHPESEDVLQIVSRPINSGDERREVLVFVMDENNLLINSHFSNNGWRMTGARRHDKQIADELYRFIAAYKSQNEKRVAFR
jgi:hypothetical protein